MVSVALIDVYSAGGALLFSVDAIEARHLLSSSQVKRFRVKHVPCLKYYAGVEPDDGPLVMSPRSIHGSNGVRRERFYVPVDDIHKRGKASGEVFEHHDVRLDDPAREHRKREMRKTDQGKYQPAQSVHP